MSELNDKNMTSDGSEISPFLGFFFPAQTNITRTRKHTKMEDERTNGETEGWRDVGTKAQYG